VVDYLINDPSRRKTGVAWYHCDYREQSSQTPAKLVGSLLRQLSLQTETVPKAVLDFYELHKNESVQPQAKDILKVLLGVSIEFARCFVVIDALDEVEKKHRKEYMKIIQELKNGSVKVFVTSRPHLHDIVTAFSGDLLIDVAADQKDIKLFLSKILEDDENMEELLDDKLRKEILDKLSCHAGGMFLLPALQIQTIVDQVTKSDIRLALSSLSFNIHEVFENAIQRIQSQPGSRQKVAMQSLMWISYARRPLSVDELCHALATRMGDRELDKDNLIPIKTIVESCSGLVVIDHESSTVRLVHFSFQEYLQVRRKFLFPAGDSIIASICLTYASFRRLSSISSEDSVTALKYLAQDYPLLGYSYHHWGYHAKADLNMEMKELVMQFLTEPSHTLWDAFVQALSNPRYSLSSSSWAQLSEGNSLHCIARFGLFQLIPSIIQTGALPNTLDHHGNTPLHEATLFGQMEAAKVLLEHGAEIDAYNDDANTSLFIACSAGDEELIALFLKFGAEPDMPCKDGWTSLHRAAHYGHLGAVKLLLKNGASQRSKSSRGVTALHRAAGRGHNEVVDLLLQRGCEVDSMTSDSWTPLHGAASSGQHGTMSLLLARGASVNYQSQDGRTALHRACRGGYIEAVKVLLLGGADRMIADEFGMIPLHRAAKGGHPEIMHVLLDVERDLQARQLSSPNHFSMTPHDVALAAGFYDLAKDLRVTPSMPQRQSELEIAVEQGDEKSLRSLLSQGADCNQPTMDGLTPFHQAILLDQHELALIMLENGANVDAPALNGWPALHSAARKGSLSSVQICLQHGAAVMSRDIRKKTPLHKACQGGNVEVVRLLLREGADSEAEDDYSWRPIHACAAAGHGDVARLLLLERDVQLDTRDISGRTPQACAARAGHHDLVEFLRTERPW
jgi:ankyrin repeat protein